MARPRPRRSPPQPRPGFGVAALQQDLALGKSGFPGAIVFRGVEDPLREASVRLSTEHYDLSHRINASGAPFATGCQLLGMSEDEAREFAPVRRHLHPFGVRDVVVMSAVDVDAQCVVLTAPVADVGRPSREQRALWNRIAAHVRAGARLRARLDPSGAGDISASAEAVLSPSGKLEHGLAPATAPRMRDSLRRAAIAIDRARTRAGRADANAALDLWQGLVAGRWSLVDRFDSDGRRFLVARRNDPDVPDPRALTRRERQVLAYAAMGQPLKLIAYALGLSVSTIALYRGRAMRKLGLTSTAEVVRMFAREPAKETVA